MRKDREGHQFPPYRVRPDRKLAEQYLRAQQAPVDLAEVPPTYMIFLRGEPAGVDLFQALEIPRHRALHGGQRYEWYGRIGWDDEIEVTASVRRVTEKIGSRGTLWFGDIDFEYRRVGSPELLLLETTRLIERGPAQ